MSHKLTLWWPLKHALLDRNCEKCDLIMNEEAAAAAKNIFRYVSHTHMKLIKKVVRRNFSWKLPWANQQKPFVCFFSISLSISFACKFPLSSPACFCFKNEKFFFILWHALTVLICNHGMWQNTEKENFSFAYLP